MLSSKISNSEQSVMKQSLYLETSVIGAYLDNGEPFRRDLTIRWWEHEITDYRTVISPLVLREIERVPEPHQSSYLNLIAPLEQVELTEEAAILADGYISRGIFHRKYIADALHVAIASYHKIDYLVTWNFGHLANVRRQARIRLFNTAAGFYVPMIVTPEFLVSEATESVK
jgi:predicted nucleic acid-binding protein